MLMMWREFANFSLPESVQLFCNNWHDCRHMILCCTLSSTFETVLNTIYRTDTLIPLNLIAANLSKERITWLRTFLLQSRQIIIMKKSGLNWEKKCVRTAERGFNCITRREYSLWSGAITKASVLIVTMKCNCFIVQSFCRNDFYFFFQIGNVSFDSWFEWSDFNSKFSTWAERIYVQLISFHHIRALNILLLFFRTSNICILRLSDKSGKFSKTFSFILIPLPGSNW